MSGVFQNILTLHPPNRLSRENPPAFGAGGGHTRWVERAVGGQYFGRRLYSTYVGTLWSAVSDHYRGQAKLAASLIEISLQKPRN